MEVKGRNVFEKHDKGIKRILQQSLQCFSLLGLQAETEAVHERWHPYVSMVIPAWKLLWLHQLPCQHQPAHGDITFNSEITEYTSRWNQQNYALQTVHTITAELRSDLALQFFSPHQEKKWGNEMHRMYMQNLYKIFYSLISQKRTSFSVLRSHRHEPDSIFAPNLIRIKHFCQHVSK